MTTVTRQAPAGRAAVIAGIGSYVPPDVVTNQDLTRRLDTSDEWIRSRTGIATRHVVSAGTATSDLAVEAGQRALKSAGSADVDAVVLATTTPDHSCPATAPAVAARLGLTGVPAFDVAAVCTGFLYGLASASGLIAAGIADRVLLVAADAFTTIINPDDRTTAVIFADGAGAVVLRAGRPDEPGAIGPLVLGSDGSLGNLIEVPAGGSRQRSSGRSAPLEDHYFQMRGRDTYRHAVERMTAASLEAVERRGWTMADIDRFAAHQANARILTAVSDRLEVPVERQLSNIEHVGNTGGASIPLLLSQAAQDGRLTAGQKVLLTAFGGGLAWGATALHWPVLTPF
ncbi:beta-ketoacyl-ACP synthase III [Streptomyces caelestis]|jgi:3-oxoacyl-[acyl-carrier-protein] synthase-3|uniref:Beta-ketoacyl-[acyl-carrier-protein] synthase III n=1 Tax=Streptomyces caelestis TaxID=36816 RepID=A0A7W9LQ56_9ACTN|nr:beta-ketoacyl-ACP synthase III [Streptomyces caelestis]MBB5792133.1 3-oxoacyl-[acyl-carrier-protein] synthase-3 [Streptomyces caelestis]GGW79739.1 3-oxoacyl-[acyl-carrier-protein] synthase 3 protein 3 [Streptomyces caelestis]